MYLLYVDASGVPDIGGAPPLYCIVGLCIHEGTWFALERRLAGLKRRYSCSGESFELHAKDLVHRYPEQNQIKGFGDMDRQSRRSAVREARTKHLAGLAGAKASQTRRRDKETDAFVHLTASERTELLADSLDLVGTHDGVRLFGEVVDKSHHFSMAGEEDVVRSSFTQIVSRFDQFLTTVNRVQEPTSPQRGMLIMDNEPAHASKLAELLDRFRIDGHPFGVVHNVIETPMFVDSRSAGGIQLADICAYATRRYVEKQAADDSPDGINFHRIFAQFHRGGARLHGIRHYCARGSCVCAVCRERGHANQQSITMTGATITDSEIVGIGIPDAPKG